MQSPRGPWIFYLLFALSGFSGLIYESAWTQYLKLLLGHAAYAQALVLIIYMGGMSLGAWWAARLSSRVPNLIGAYAAVEAVIGLFALGFHWLFDWLSGIAHGVILPAMPGVAAAQVAMWLLAALIILPQSLLLGSTFPLMSAGIIRRFPERPGRELGTLYFSNTLGGAVGVLASGFILIAWMGLPGTLRTAGLINLGVAGIIMLLLRRETGATAATPQVPTGRPHLPLLAAALLTGAASFIYEIGWVRMLTMVLGSSTQSFELMLCAFLIGLAFGGWWIRKRLDGLRDPLRTAALVQISMGLFALLSLPLYNFSFDAMAAFMAAAPRTDAGFLLFNLTGHGLALSLMLPATFCAGMTLPLLSWMLLSRGHGERSIGLVYAANTLGAIAGVLFALFIGMPQLGLHGTILSGAALDMGLGLAFVAAARGREWHRELALAAAVCLFALAAGSLLGTPDPRRMASSVFRAGYALDPAASEIVFHRDGSAATVALKRLGEGMVLTINGKPDASLSFGEAEPEEDEITMVLSAAIPLSLHPQAERVASIGMGSGLTAHTLLAWPGLRRVDTIEIEPAVIEAVGVLGPRVAGVFTDPRSRIHIEDARAFFSRRGERYDIIISEPSNPWVSGVAMLFTEEFYGQIRNYLMPGGLFVQWLQLYEIDSDLVFSILKAFSRHFPQYSLYRTDGANILIVGRVETPAATPSPAVIADAGLAPILARVGIYGVGDIVARQLGDERDFAPLLADSPAAANSDYHPVLDQRAVKARFLRRNASVLLLRASK